MAKQTRWSGVGRAVAGALVLAIVPVYAVSAQRFTSPSYTIDASTLGNTFGGATSSASYKMVSSGGETVIGNGQGGSYKLTQGYVAQLEKSLQLTVQPSGLAGYYPMDEGIGTAVNDGSTNGNRGITLNGPSWAAGKVGQALSFNGTNQGVSVPSSTSLNIETVTVSAWVKTTQAPVSPAYAAIVEKWTGSGGYPYVLRLNASGQVVVGAYDGTNNPAVASTSAINDGIWHHIVGVRTKSGPMAIYVDGVKQATGTDNTTVATTNTSPVGVGLRTDNTYYFNGSTDEVKIYSRVLSDSEIKAEYDAGNAGDQAGLAFAQGLIAGTPQNIDARAVIQTDAPGYNLALSQNQDLTNGVNTIGAINNGGTITTPAAWTDGTTKGFGFTLTAASPGLDAKWGTGANYAALPGTATTFFSRSGYTTGAKDTLDIRYRLDVTATQVAGTYTNTVTYTGTMVP